MIRTYTYKLYKNEKVEKKFNRWLDGTRYVYNLAKETKELAYQAGGNLSCYDLFKQLTECRKEFSWLRNINAKTLQVVIEQLDNTYRNFFSKRARYPKWTKKRDWKSFGFKQGNLSNSRPDLRFEKEGVFNLPKFGKVKVFKKILARNPIHHEVWVG